jgi:hypothetical protein
VTRAVRIEVTARSADEGLVLAERIMRWMSPHVIGDPARFQTVAMVQPDAPAGAAIKVTTGE